MPVALILQFLPYLFQAAKAVPEIYEFVHRTRTALQQSNEWTQEMEDNFNTELVNLKANPPDWWKEGR